MWLCSPWSRVVGIPIVIGTICISLATWNILSGSLPPFTTTAVGTAPTVAIVVVVGIVAKKILEEIHAVDDFDKWLFRKKDEK